MEFEPSATALEKEGTGYVVASLGVDSGYVPYTSYSARTSYIEKNPEIIQSFVNGLQKGVEFVRQHTPEEIAAVIYVPYTSYSARTSYIEKNPEIIQSFVNGLQKGVEFVRQHTPEEIAAVIAPQFPETDADTLTTIVKRYYDQDTWKENLIFEQASFELLQDILEGAGIRIPGKKI